MSKQFHIGDVLSITTGVALSLPEFVEGRSYVMEGIYDILNYMSDDDLQTLALPRTSDEAKPYLERQFPWTKDVNVPNFKELPLNGQDAINGAVRAFVLGLAREHGEWLDVIPMFEGDHEHLTPLEDIQRIDPTKTEANLFSIDASGDEPPSPTGDINWKVDNGNTDPLPPDDDPIFPFIR